MKKFILNFTVLLFMGTVSRVYATDAVEVNPARGFGPAAFVIVPGVTQADVDGFQDSSRQLEAAARYPDHAEGKRDALARWAMYKGFMGDEHWEAAEYFSTLSILRAAEALKRLGEDALALEAFSRAVHHPRASTRDVYTAALGLDRVASASAKAGDPVAQSVKTAWSIFLGQAKDNRQVYADNLYHVATRFQWANSGQGYAKRAWALLIAHPQATPTHLQQATAALARLGTAG